MIKKQDLIELSDGNTYIVCSNIEYDGRMFFYLADIKNAKNIKFCEFDEFDTMKVVKDDALFEQILPMFSKDCAKFLKEEFLREISEQD